jgi:Kef-type K+ transport system membrane component KefB
MLEQQLPMFLILFGVAAIPFLARRLRIPSAALEILYGLLLFNFLLHQRPDWFDLLRELGFVYLQ